MNDLLDVLHCMFEEDMIPATGEQQEARAKLRKRIYTDIYGWESYIWDAPSEGKGGGAESLSASGEPPLSTNEKPRHYGYIPPTEFDPDAAKPFGDVLDAPLG